MPKVIMGETRSSPSDRDLKFQANSRGIIAGIDKKLTEHFKLGAGMQYNSDDLDAYHRDIRVHTTIGYIYNEYRLNKWFMNGVASYGVSDYRENIFVGPIRIKDKYKAEVYSLQGLTGYNFKYFTPEIGARYYHVSRHGHTDSLGQKVAGKDMDLLRGLFGVRVSHKFGEFTPEIYAGVTYDFISDEDHAAVTLPNGAVYNVYGRRLARFGTEFNTSVTYDLSDKASINVGYEGKFRKHYQDHTGYLNIRYEF